MTIRRKVIPVAVALLVASVGLGYISQKSAERAVIGSYNELDAALSKRDLPRYMALLSPDYTEIRLTESPKNRAQAEANYRHIIADWSDLNFAPVEVETFSVKHSIVNTTVKRTTRGTLLDRNGAFGIKGANHKMVSVTVSLDRWQNTSGQWLLKRHNVSLVQIYIDGKLLPGGTAHDND